MPPRSSFWRAKAECALVYTGSVQAVRCRESEVTSVIGVAHANDMMGITVTNYVREAERSLLELVATPDVASPEPSSVQVRYIALNAGDLWVLAGAPLFEQRELTSLAALTLQADTANPASLAAIRKACEQRHGPLSQPLPVLMLATAQSPAHG